MADPDLPECLACGACCFADVPDYVRVSGADHARLGGDAEALVTWRENRAYMRMVDGHCAALVISGSDGTLSCRVYERRPTICRDLERGSRACLGEREHKADRARLTLERAK
jgi:Fe-S-cluster containining protein